MNGRNVTALAALTLLTTLTLSAKAYRADQYTVNLELTSRGTLEVTETVRFRFNGGPFTFAFRDISGANTDGIEEVQAWMDDKPCPVGTEPGSIEIRGSRVKWHFAKVFSELHTFRVRYTALGTIRKLAEGDTLVWRALPMPREYPLEAAEIELSYPDGVEAPKVTLASGKEARIENGKAKLTLYELSPKADVVLTARFAPNAFASATPQWASEHPRAYRSLQMLEQAEQAERREAFNQTAAAAAPVGIGALALILWWLRKKVTAWPAPAAPGATIPSSVPPDSLPAALAARLLEKHGQLPALLLDLARRGVLSIEEGKRHWGSRRFEIRRTMAPSPVAPYERLILDAAFRGATSVTLQQFQQRTMSGRSGWSRALDAELVERGLYRAGAPEARGRVRTTALLLFVAGVLFAPLTFAFYKTSGLVSGTCLVVALAAFAGAVSAVVSLSMMSPLTEAGADTKNRWEGFIEYLKRAQKEPALMPSGNAWNEVLPYAAAFTLAGPLVKAAKKQGRFDVPDWFEAADAAGHDAFYGFIDASSTAYGGDGGAGGGGASGGGASGAG